MAEKKYTCENARRDIKIGLGNSTRSKDPVWLFRYAIRTISHMRGSFLPYQRRTIKCPRCWDYFAEGIKQKGEYNCENCKADIMFFFTGGGQKRPYEALREKASNRALAHMVTSTPKKKHKVVCKKCWDYYMEMKGTHCGG